MNNVSVDGNVQIKTCKESLFLFFVCLLNCFDLQEEIKIWAFFVFKVLVNDFFLVACLEDFIENARLFIFETFCRIHQCISIRLVTKK